MNEIFGLLDKSSTRPCVFVIGDKSCLEFSGFFIYHNGHLLRATTLLQAVFTAFKSYFVFNVTFPVEAYDVWAFLDFMVFDLKRNPLNSAGNLLVSHIYALDDDVNVTILFFNHQSKSQRFITMCSYTVNAITYFKLKEMNV